MYRNIFGLFRAVCALVVDQQVVRLVATAYRRVSHDCHVHLRDLGRLFGSTPPPCRLRLLQGTRRS